MKFKRRHGEFKKGCVMSESYTATDALPPLPPACRRLACSSPETFYFGKFVRDERHSWTEVPLYSAPATFIVVLEFILWQTIQRFNTNGTDVHHWTWALASSFHIFTTNFPTYFRSVSYLLLSHIWSYFWSVYSSFSGLVVSMLASGTQVRGFKPGQSRRIFSGEKILSMPSFGREVKHVKEPCDYMEVGSQAKLSQPFLTWFLPLLIEDSVTCVAWSASGVDERN
jgi:hypothetical protein